MSEHYTYPQAEHYVFPKTRAEIIQDELNFYKDPEDMRAMGIGLARLYAEAPIVSSMQKYAVLMNVVHLATKGYGERTRVDGDFLMGTIYGIHTTVHTESPGVRKRVLGLDPMRGIDGTAENEKERAFQQELMGWLQTWEATDFEKEFERAPEELQTSLLDLTKHMYCGIQTPQEREQSFMSGYMFVTNMIDVSGVSGSVTRA